MNIFWVSDPVLPGEAIIVNGDGFGDSPTVDIEDLVTKQKTALTPIQPTDMSVKAILPKTLSADCTYRVTITNGDKIAQAFVNSPSVYWAQGDMGASATKGGTIRIFGRCLTSKEGLPEITVSSITDGMPRDLEYIKSSKWDALFGIPDDIEAGTYTIYFSNGRKSLWTKLNAPIEIRAKVAPVTTIFNVRTYGAVGNGLVDDSNAVIAAINAAGSAGGGIVYFPRGKYLMSQPITIPKMVTIKGERRDLVNLAWKDFTTAIPFYLIKGSNNFSIEDITIYALRYNHLIASDILETADGKPGNVSIKRVTVRANIYRGHLTPADVNQRFIDSNKLSSGGGDTIRVSGENVVIADCDLYGSGRCLFLKETKNSYVARNKLYSGRIGSNFFTGVSALIFEDNEFIGADLMSCGGGINNLYNTNGSRNIFFSNNKFKLFHGWDREAVTTDAGGGLYCGTVASITDYTFSIPQDTPNIDKPAGWGGAGTAGWGGAGAFILAGKGAGQYREIVKIDAGVVTLDKSWMVNPDQASVVTITAMHKNYLFVNNLFEDVGIAIQYYGTSINNIAAGNVLNRGGIIYNGGRYYAGGYQPSFYCQFLDNNIMEGNMYGYNPNNTTLSGDSWLGTSTYPAPSYMGPMNLSSVHRRNRLESNANIMLWGSAKKATPYNADVIIENNTVSNSDVGIKIDEGSIRVLDHNNTFSNVVKERDYKSDSVTTIND